MHVLGMMGYHKEHYCLPTGLQEDPLQKVDLLVSLGSADSQLDHYNVDCKDHMGI